jgi:hypothetical protein
LYVEELHSDTESVGILLDSGARRTGYRRRLIGVTRFLLYCDHYRTNNESQNHQNQKPPTPPFGTPRFLSHFPNDLVTAKYHLEGLDLVQTQTRCTENEWHFLGVPQ